MVLAVKDLLEERLFGTDPNLYWAMLVALAGFALAYFARGYLAGKGRFSIYAALLISEVVGRLVFAVLVAIGILDEGDADRDRDRRRTLLRTADDR